MKKICIKCAEQSSDLHWPSGWRCPSPLHFPAFLSKIPALYPLLCPWVCVGAQSAPMHILFIAGKHLATFSDAVQLSMMIWLIILFHWQKQVSSVFFSTSSRFAISFGYLWSWLQLAVSFSGQQHFFVWGRNSITSCVKKEWYMLTEVKVMLTKELKLHFKLCSYCRKEYRNIANSIMKSL